MIDIYPGRDFPNLAISEVLIGLKEFDGNGLLTPSGENPDHIIMDAQDLNARTYWATAAEGASVEISSDTFGLSSIDIQAGPKTHARPKTVRVTAQRRSRTQVLEDVPGAQNVLIPAITGYTGSAWGSVKLEFLDVYPGTKSEELAVAELGLKATNMEGL